MPTYEAPNEGILNRHIKWVEECKDAVQALRLTTKQAKAHREQCCSVLGAALAASLAVEQAVYSRALNIAKAQELQRLYAAIIAAIELAQQRVQVYGAQSRIRKYTSLLRRAAVDHKFSQIVGRLDDLTKQVWALSAGDSPDPAGIAVARQALGTRIHVNTTSSASVGNLGAVSTGLTARSRLRRGCQCHAVCSVLYVGPSQGRPDSAHNAGQVWWFLGSTSSGKVFVHDLASASTKELQAFQSESAVACMQMDSQGYVWMGFKGGLVQVWDPQTRSCVCKLLSSSAADARVLSADPDSNSMWLGTDTGMVSQLTLTARKVDSRLVYSIDTLQTLQLAQVGSQSTGLVYSAVTSVDALSPFAARHQRQLPSPFSEAPRQLTLSSSASSYRGSNGIIELVQNPLLQPPHASFPASIPSESRVPNPSSVMTDQPLSNPPFPSNQPGTAIQHPLGPTPRHPPGRAFSAELLHGNPNQRPGTPLLLSRPPSLRRSGSSSPADSTRLEGGLPQMQRQSSAQQGSLHSAGSFRSATGRDVSASAASTPSLPPVHAMLVLGRRVITSSGFKPHCALKEWSLGGALLATHPCCELGCCTCIAAVPELLQTPTSAPAQTPTPPSSPLSYKPSGSASWQMLTGHRTGHVKLWQASYQERLQALAVITPARNSPVQSLVVLPSLHLICSGHLDGHIALYIIPDPSSPHQCIPAHQNDGSLPALPLPSAAFEAHRSGLQQCVAGDTGLLSLGALGSIMVWPRAELQSTLSNAGLLARSADEMMTNSVVQPLKQHLSRHLERAFTPRSARAVGSALDQLMHQIVQEEEAQAHHMPPALAALQRGDPIRAQDTPRVLREVMQMLTLSHADSNEAPLPAHTPLVPPLYPTPVPSLHKTSQNFDAAPLRHLHRTVSGPAQANRAQPLYSQRAQRYSADLELQSHRPAIQSTDHLSAEPLFRDGIAHHVGQTSGDWFAAQQAQHAQQRPLYDCQGLAGESQHAEQRQSSEFAHVPSAESEARRVSFERDAAVDTQTRVPQPAELSHAEQPVVKASPPPIQADSVLYQPGASSRRVSAASYDSPSGSTGTYRASSQVLPPDPHPSDLLSPHGSAATDVVQPGSQQQGGVGVSGGEGGQPSLDRAAMSVLQSQGRSPMVVSPLPKSRSHANLRQGLDRVSAESGVSVEPDRAALAASAAASVQSMRRTKSKLSMDTLASVESMNCPIIEYSQLEIKRKIGDGSIGQVYLGKWQETDVAIKVLTEMQNLSPQGGAHLQDAAGGTQASPARAVKDGTESHGWGTDDDDASIGQDSGSQTPEDNKEALKTLEREVSIMSAIRHPNVVLFMGLCLEPPCIVTEFCARGSLYDVLKKARSTPAFAQQLDWSRRLSMALDAAKGVLQLHSHKPPILHRDLKSPNMVVDRHWRVKVTDFNLSRMVQTGSNKASVTSLLANNPRWLAPEVVSKHDYSKAADVYSFGIILWEMMTWRLPWEELNPFQIMMALTQQHARPELPPLETLPGQPLPGIQDYLQLMQDCWHEDPSKRPRYEDIIISLRGLLESAANRHKLQKTLTAVPRLSTSCAVAPNMNKLPVVGQTPFGSPGTDPQQTPTPLDGVAKPGPLQVYETHCPFFGSTPAGGLDIVTSAATDPKRNADSNGNEPGPGGQAQQTLPASALKGKSRSPGRRHTFNGTATCFGDEFDTAPSIFTIGASSRIGGVHAKFNAGDALDPARRKSMSAHASTVDQTTGQQPLPDWLLRQREAAFKGHSRLAQPPGKLDSCSTAKDSQPDSADSERHAGPSGSSDKGESQVTAGELLQSRPGGPSSKGSSQAPPPPVPSLTPFSAFAQHNQQMQSRSSSGSAESDNPEGPNAERKASGRLARKRSGSFGGRGAALGFMMEAQQRWRQDSFTKAAERRRDEQSSEAGRNSRSSLLSNSDQPAVQHSEAPPSASNPPSLAQNKVAGGSLQQQPSIANTGSEAHSTAGSRGCGLPASSITAGIHSQSQSEAGPGSAERPLPAGIAGQAAKASGHGGVSQHQPVQSAFEAPNSAAMMNPFLAAAQQWRESSSDGSTDQLHHGNDGADDLPEQTSHTSPFAVAADSAAIAEQWLTARQELLEHSDQCGESGANPGGASARSATSAVQSGRGQSSSHTTQRDATHQESEHRHGHVRKRSMSVKAGPPPENGSFQKSHPAVSASGVESSSSSASIASQESHDFNRSSVSPKSVPRACRPPPSRRASFSPSSISQRLDTIQSDSSAEALAQHASNKSSSASAASSQLTHATAIIDSALKESVSGSGNHSERLPSLLLSRELDDVPFQTRLQTVIEGLEQVNSPTKGSIAAQSGTKILHANGSITVASPKAKNSLYCTPFAAGQAADLL